MFTPLDRLLIGHWRWHTVASLKNYASLSHGRRTSSRQRSHHPCRQIDTHRQLQQVALSSCHHAIFFDSSVYYSSAAWSIQRHSDWSTTSTCHSAEAMASAYQHHNRTVQFICHLLACQNNVEWIFSDHTPTQLTHQVCTQPKHSQHQPIYLVLVNLPNVGILLVFYCSLNWANDEL